MVLTEIVLNVYINLGRNDALVFSPLTCEHYVLLHLVRSLILSVPCRFQSTNPVCILIGLFKIINCYSIEILGVSGKGNIKGIFLLAFLLRDPFVAL